MNEPQPARAGPALSTEQRLLVAVVSFAWVAALFLPVPVQTQIGVQAAMSIVLGAIFGRKAVRKQSNGGENGGT